MVGPKSLVCSSVKGGALLSQRDPCAVDMGYSFLKQTLEGGLWNSLLKDVCRPKNPSQLLVCAGCLICFKMLLCSASRLVILPRGW